jgi:lipopolysaccharide export system permease protein
LPKSSTSAINSSCKMKFKILDRYILKELIDPFLFGLGSFTVIMASSTVMFELVRAVIIKGMPVTVAIQIFIFRLPAVMVYIFPMAMLLAALLGFARLSNDSEVVAFRSAGISLYRLMLPVLFMGLIVSFLTMLFYEIVVPESSDAAKQLLITSTVKFRPKIQRNMFIPEIDHESLKRVFYAREANGNVMKGVIVGEFEGQRLAQLINAEEAVWQADKDSWAFKNGIIYILSEDGEYKHLVRFKEQVIAIKYSPADFYIGEKKAEEMNIMELSKFIALKKKMGEGTTDNEIQLNMKIAIPFACLVFSLLGAPLGLTPKRASSSIGLGISIIIIFAYYIMMSISIAFGELNWLPPPIAAWTPNVATAGVGWHLLHRAAKG